MQDGVRGIGFRTHGIFNLVRFLENERGDPGFDMGRNLFDMHALHGIVLSRPFSENFSKDEIIFSLFK